MSTSSTTDPVETVIDILEAAAAGDWTAAGGAPDHIERYNETDYDRKQRRDTVDAVYVLKTDAGNQDKLGAGFDPYIDDHTVRAEVWTPTSDSAAHDYKTDVASIIRDYAADNKAETQWQQVAPIGDDDERPATPARGVDHYIMAVLVQLIAAR